MTKSFEKTRQERIDIARGQIEAYRRQLENVRDSREHRRAMNASTVQSATDLATLMEQMAEQLERDARTSWGDAKTLRDGAEILKQVERRNAEGALLDARAVAERNGAKARAKIEAEVARLEAAK